MRGINKRQIAMGMLAGMSITALYGCNTVNSTEKYTESSVEIQIRETDYTEYEEVESDVGETELPDPDSNSFEQMAGNSIEEYTESSVEIQIRETDYTEYEEAESDVGETELPDPDSNSFEQMAGKWIIDFSRTDSVWGSGISYGNEMELSAAGEFRYYIGIGVGGTGQCEIHGGEVTVEIEPYEDLTSEKEVLTLQYISDLEGEYILMRWYDVDVYWIRDTQSS